jgi:hypothetical protein
MPLPELTSEMLCEPSAEGKVTCMLCHNVYHDPKCHVDCGHYACGGCWSKVVQAGFDACPACRCALRPGGIKWNAAMEALLGSVRVKCGEGCLWTGPLETYENHLEKCQAKRLKEMEAASRQATQTASARIAELSTSLAQSRADHTRDVDTKEEALKAVLEASAAEESESRSRLAATEYELKTTGQALASNRLRLAKTESQIPQLQDVLQEVLCVHEEYKTRLESEMASNRAALEKYKAVAMKGGRGRSRSPPAALTKSARV